MRNAPRLERKFQDPWATPDRLVLGMSGVACYNLRAALRLLGCWKGPEGGDEFDTSVAAGVLAFQQKVGHYNQDGVVGKRTRMLLVERLIEAGHFSAVNYMNDPGGGWPHVFVSYRRRDVPVHLQQRLFARLERTWGRVRIFRDVESIAPGTDFRQALIFALARCDVLLAVIGELWLSMTDETGARRLDNPADFVRLEVEQALAEHRTVIPVLVGHHAMPKAALLPHSLSGLVNHQAVEIGADPYFESGLNQLVVMLGSGRF